LKIVRRYELILVILSVLILNQGCEELFTGMGPQPDYIEKDPFSPRLNVLGVLRPDFQNNLPMSFVYLEKSLDILEDTEKRYVTDATVMVYSLDNGSIDDSLQLVYMEMGSTFDFNAYRNFNLIPVPAHQYRIVCQKEGLPTISDVVQIPDSVVIVDGSLNLKGEIFSFKIARDEFAFLYEIILRIDGESEPYQENIRRPNSGDVYVSIQLKDVPASKEGSLRIYAYDENLAEYKTYNVGIKPNTFRTDYTTVENGYGCLGALNFLEKKLQF
jgi:hypothetical protein